ncbi:MAG: VOC family protein [Bacteroidota bacterium]
MPNIAPIPKGYHTVNPFIITDDLPALVSFLEKAFDATPYAKTVSPKGAVLNLELRVGDSILMLSSARGGFGPFVMSFYLYVEDVDKAYEKALAAGGQSFFPPTDQFYGNRDCGIVGPRGNYWFIGSRKEELTEEEITRRMPSHLED